MKKLILIIIVLAVAGGGAAAYYMRKSTKEPEIRTAQITRGDVVQSVQATGTLEAVTTVQVGTQVGGIVQELYADFNDIVKKGKVIARLDPTILDTQIEQQRANVTRSEADLERLRVSLADAKQKLDRAKALSDKNLLPRSELETADVNVRSAEAQIRSSEAGLVQAKSQLHTAEVNREHTVITAPIDGIVIQRSVEPGQTVNAGMSAPTLFILAADLTKMQVRANIDEADVGRMRPGQNVTFRVDAFPTEQFIGMVQQVRLQPTTVQNVVTYQTVIDVPNNEMKLKPGMTATVVIEIMRKTNVLRMPAAATRFRPTAEIFAALKQAPPPDFGRGGFGGGRNARNAGTAGAGAPGGGQQAPAGPLTNAAPNPPAAANAPAATAPARQTNAAPQGRRQQREGSAAEARGGGDRPAGAPGGNAAPDESGGGRGGVGGGRGFDPNMTAEQREERRKRMEERMAAMTPEERAAFQERMAQRAQGGGRGGFGGGQGQAGNRDGQGQSGGRGGVGGARTGTDRQSANAQGATRGTPMGRVASTPSMKGSATTIDALFGPLPVEESRGSAWLWENKQLKQVRLRLGVSDTTFTEIMEATPEVHEGNEVVTNIILEQATTTPGGANANNPLMGPQRGRGGPGGGPGGGGGGRGGGR
jgi:HlyD family secretion protein